MSLDRRWEPPSDLCNTVRASCRVATESARLLTIDDVRLAAVARELEPWTEIEGPRSVSSGAGAAADRFERVALLTFALDAVNFGSGFHDIVVKEPGLSGARTMATRLRQFEATSGPLRAETLGTLSSADCHRIFGQPPDDGPRDELMTWFGRSLNDLGWWLDERGSATAAIEAARRSAERLATDLSRMPSYRDVADLGGLTVSFFKRAQITAADLVRELGVELFDDLDQLTAFADNLVPHVLRVDGVIQLDHDLDEAIGRRELLTPGGRAEIELRAAAVEVVERLVERVGRPAHEVDRRLWERGGSPRYKAVPRPRARSVFY